LAANCLGREREKGEGESTGVAKAAQAAALTGGAVSSSSSSQQQRTDLDQERVIVVGHAGAEQPRAVRRLGGEAVGHDHLRVDEGAAVAADEVAEGAVGLLHHRRHRVHRSREPERERLDAGGAEGGHWEGCGSCWLICGGVRSQSLAPEVEPAKPMFMAGRIGAERLSTSRSPDQRRHGP